MYGAAKYTQSQCKKAEIQRQFFLSKMWSTPILTPERAAYEKKANKWAAIVEGCKVAGRSSSTSSGRSSNSSTQGKPFVPAASTAATTPRTQATSFRPSTSPGAQISAMPGTSPTDPGFQTSASAAAAASTAAATPTWLYALGGIAALGGGYYLYQRSKKAKSSGGV